MMVPDQTNHAIPRKLITFDDNLGAPLSGSSGFVSS